MLPLVILLCWNLGLTFAIKKVNRSLPVFQQDQMALPEQLSLYESNGQLLNFERHSEDYLKVSWDMSQIPYCDIFNIKSATESGKHEYGTVVRERVTGGKNLHQTLQISQNPNGQKSVDVSSLNSIAINGLNPSATYVAAIANISALGLASLPTIIEQNTPPLISSVLEAERITKKSLLITFTPTDADGAIFDKYDLELLISEKANASVSKKRGSKSRSILFKGLEPGRRYLCRLYTVYQGIRSEPVTQIFTTYPDKIQRLRIVSRSTSVKLFWQRYGDDMPYIRYRITCFDPTEGRAPLVLETAKDNLLIEKLEPSSWYTFSATVIADDLESDTDAITVMTIGRDVARSVQFRKADQTIAAVSFGRNFFPDSNGVVDQYYIIVTEDEQLDKFYAYHMGWKSVQKYAKWPPYLAYSVKKNPFSNPKVQSAEYLIGAEDCYNELRYCNGPLKAESQYFVKVQGCTVAMICMETGYIPLTSEDVIVLTSELFNFGPYCEDLLHQTPLMSDVEARQLEWDALIATEATQRRDTLLQKIADHHYQLGFKAQGPLSPAGRLVLVALFFPGMYLYLTAACCLGRLLSFTIYSAVSFMGNALSVSKKVLLHLLSSLMFTAFLSAATVYIIDRATCNSVLEAIEVFIYGSLFIGTGRCVTMKADDLKLSLVGIPLYSATMFWFLVCTVRLVRQESLLILKQELPGAICKSNIALKFQSSELEYVDIHSKVMESLKTLPDGAWMLHILDSPSRCSLDRTLLRLVSRRERSMQTDATVKHVAMQVGRTFS
ncbi:Tyrosine protein phosphatase 10D [Trichuris trichiura]|uniref:protein-tyrosine-phosphatase n=1 Tax=Trichuris trichiura TaxID=36087 RepID=A0A077YZS8_TRITR|nr:Tyrosine protein phosphatase 10D [Trichuris trichiura]